MRVVSNYIDGISTFVTNYEVYESDLITHSIYETDGISYEQITFYYKDGNIKSHRNESLSIKKHKLESGYVTEETIGNRISYAYNSQYGITITKDGKHYFVPKWEGGLSCYNINNNELIWKIRLGKIRNVFIYKDFNKIYCERADDGLLILDFETQEIINKIKFSASLGAAYRLNEEFFIVGPTRNKYQIYDFNTITLFEQVNLKKYLDSSHRVLDITYLLNKLNVISLNKDDVEKVIEIPLSKI